MLINKWFIIPKPKSKVDLKLICFPYAGGNSSTYMSWAKYLPENVELIIVQPPGRGSRIFEPIYSDMKSLISDLLWLIPEHLNTPYILLGHSLGSRIAFELMVQLNKLKFPLPLHFIASGSRAPHLASDKKRIFNLPDKEFISELKKLNGTPKDVLENNELMELLLPMLRADFKIAENYCYSGSEIFNCPISLLAGNDDIDITLSMLEGWVDHFTEIKNIYIVSGNHFFIDNNTEAVIQKINEVIQQSLSNLSIKNQL